MRTSSEGRGFPVRAHPLALPSGLYCSGIYIYIEDGPCLGERSSPTGPYQWISYGEVEERALAFGAGLAVLGLEPGQESCVGIYSQNNIEVSPAVHVCVCVCLFLCAVCVCACAVGGGRTVLQLLLPCGGASL